MQGVVLALKEPKGGQKVGLPAAEREGDALKARGPAVPRHGLGTEAGAALTITNLACRSGVSPDDVNMRALSGLAESIKAMFEKIGAFDQGQHFSVMGLPLQRSLGSIQILKERRITLAVISTGLRR